MKIIAVTFFKMMILVWLNGVILSGTSLAGNITVVGDDWSPYNSQPNSTEPGYGVEIMQHVFGMKGYSVEYKVMPWNRAIVDTRTGAYDAIIGAVKEEASDFIFPKEEFGVSTLSFFAKEGSLWRYQGLASLRSVQVGLISGYFYGERFDKFFKENHQIVQTVYGENAFELNIKKLLAGRIDVLLADMNSLQYRVKKLDVFGQIINVGETEATDNIYIAFSPKGKNSKKYAEIFSKGMQILRASGELNKILAKYGLVDWK